MKGIVIENELQVEGYIQEFLKDFPELFSFVQEELYCLHRDVKELLPDIIASDAIIVSSTWMYKDQLISFLEGFASNNFPPKKIFAHWITRRLNDWDQKNYGYEKEIITLIQKLLEKGFIIFDFFEDPKLRLSVEYFDNLLYRESKRSKYTYEKVKYSKKDKLFYNKHPYCNLKNMKDEFKK